VPSIKGILETLKQVKFRTPKPIFCPKCKSSNIYPKESYGILPSIYKCRDCKYEGNLVVELDSNEENITDSDNL
jgi:hypothetical protein